MKRFALLFSLLAADSVLAQTPVQIDAGGGINWGIAAIALAIAAVVGGLIYWHHKDPAAETVALAKANQSAHAALAASQEHVSELIAKVEILLLKLEGRKAPPVTPEPPPADAPPPAPPPPPSPTPEQLQAVAEARNNLAAAMAAAGLPN